MTKTILLAFAFALALVACGDDGGGNTDAHPPDANEGPDADPTPDASCFTNPTTHNQIINACTDSGVLKIDKNPDVPLLGPNGELPPLEGAGACEAP
jgi:hypothetical protein